MGDDAILAGEGEDSLFSHTEQLLWIVTEVANIIKKMPQGL